MAEGNNILCRLTASARSLACAEHPALSKNLDGIVTRHANPVSRSVPLRHR